LQSIYLYNDIGVSNESLRQTLQMLKSFTKYQTKTISAPELKSGTWINDAVLFIMPGGADIYYKRKLDGIGNGIINQYISNGGKYLGICAGAYYGSSEIEFGLGTKLEIIGRRDLKLFNGRAIGPLFNKYSYQDNSGATAILIQTDGIGIFPTFFNGGCYFSDGDYKLIASYRELNLPAIISVMDDHVILSGVHFEYDPATLDYNDIYLSEAAKTLLPVEDCRHKLINYILYLLKL